MSDVLFDLPTDATNTGLKSAAHISECGAYRYSLTRRWDDTLPLLVWVMLNPSTANASEDDPTIRRCVAFAKTWGYGGITVVNLYALRSTDPKGLWRHQDPIGPDNDDILAAVVRRGKVVMLAWGANAPRDRVAHVARLLWDASTAAGTRLAVLGWTKHGQPRHPLFFAAETQPEFCDEAELMAE